MKKRIIIESTAEVIEETKEPIKNNKPLINNKFLEWFIYMIGYAIVLIIVSLIFPSLYINLKNWGIYALLASMIIYVLSRTVKPIIKVLTLPITIMTMGLLYPIVNIIILKFTSIILGESNFAVKGFIGPFFVVIMISLLDIVMDGLLKPIIKGKNNG